MLQDIETDIELCQVERTIKTVKPSFERHGAQFSTLPLEWCFIKGDVQIEGGIVIFKYLVKMLTR